MKIIVVADTNKDYRKYKSVVEKNLDADIIIHLGDGEHEFFDVKNEFPDKTFYYVGGECDYGKHKMLEIVEAQGYKILCVHGHEHNVQGSLDPIDSPRGKNKPSYGLITIDDSGKLLMSIVAIQ